jgi:hypothetical protein
MDVSMQVRSGRNFGTRIDKVGENKMLYKWCEINNLSEE